MKPSKKPSQTCPDIPLKKLHHELGKVLINEARDEDLYARDSEKQLNRILPPLQLIPLLP